MFHNSTTHNMAPSSSAHIIRQTHRTRYSIDNSKPLPMSRFVHEFVKLFISDNPNIDFYELKEIFHDNLIRPSHRHLGILCDTYHFDNWTMSSKYERYYTAEGPLISSDGVGFYVNTQWSSDDFINILEIIEDKGYYIDYMSRPSRLGRVIQSHHKQPTIAAPYDSCYFNTASWIGTGVLDKEEQSLIDLVMNFHIPLKNGSLSFSDIAKNLNIEFSPERKERSIELDEQALLDELNKVKKLHDKVHEEMCEIHKRAQENPAYWDLNSDRYNKLEIEIGILNGTISNLKSLLNQPNSKRVFSYYVLGEFVSSPTPTVILYYRNIERDNSYGRRAIRLVPVFIHEIFHAWNYFQSGTKNRTILQIDEAMVEFSTIYFLERLYDFTNIPAFKDCTDWQIGKLRKNKGGIGDITAYGYGLYLSENLRNKEDEWIETYSKRSGEIDPADINIKAIIKEFEVRYPFKHEKKLKKLFQDVIFCGLTGKSRSNKTVLSPRDLMIASIQTIGKQTFNMSEILSYEPIFTAVYPMLLPTKDLIVQTILNLVNEGYLICTASGDFEIK